MLDNLMVNAINRGMLTAICAMLNLILVSLRPSITYCYRTVLRFVCYKTQFLAVPGTFYFFIGVETSGKRRCLDI